MVNLAITVWVFRLNRLKDLWLNCTHTLCDVLLTVFNTVLDTLLVLDLPCSSDSKESSYNAGDPGLILGSGRSSGKGNGKPLQYSCLENPMERGAWRATIHGVAELGMTEWLRLHCYCNANLSHSKYIYIYIYIWNSLEKYKFLWIAYYVSELSLSSEKHTSNSKSL